MVSYGNLLDHLQNHQCPQYHSTRIPLYNWEWHVTTFQNELPRYQVMVRPICFLTKPESHHKIEATPILKTGNATKSKPWLKDCTSKCPRTKSKACQVMTPDAQPFPCKKKKLRPNNDALVSVKTMETCKKNARSCCSFNFFGTTLHTSLAMAKECHCQSLEDIGSRNQKAP